MRNWRILPTLAALALAVAACGHRTSNQGLVARAGDHELTVDHVVQLLANQESVPLQRQVIQAVAGLWVDYTLLATDAAGDSTLHFLDLEPLVRMQLDQETIAQYSDSAIPVDTAISDAELRTLYEREAPSAHLRARHILLKYPPNATQAQRDSVRSELEGIRKRAVAGASFAELARKYSQDAETASKGGELGEFGRGELPAALDSAAFALKVGEISGVVESPYGLHILKLDAKVVPPFDSVRRQYRAQVQQERSFHAESTFVARLDSEAAPTMDTDAVETIRQVASHPDDRLSSGARAKPLMSYKGGKYTVGQFQDFVQTRSLQWRTSVQSATDQQIESFLHGMVQRELMLAKARAAGMGPSKARVDSLVEGTRKQLVELTGRLGLLHLDRTPGEALGPAVDKAVDGVLEGALAGTKQVVPLGPVGLQLRQGHDVAIYDGGISDALVHLQQVRASQRPSGPAGQGDTTRSAPDSAGR